MRNLISTLAASALLVAFAAPSVAADSMSGSSMMMAKCPKGQMAVKGYKKADGTMVKSYCKKSSMMGGHMSGSMMKPAPKSTM